MRKSFAPALLIIIILASIIGIFSYWYWLAPKQETKPPAENKKNWAERLLYYYDPLIDPFAEEGTKWGLRSANWDGTSQETHPLICGSEEVQPLGNVTRSPEGKIIAFLVPTKEQKEKSPNWKKDLPRGKKPFTQGVITLFDLEKNLCKSTGITADVLYEQTLAFSPNGKYLAYSFYGLNLYDLKPKEKTRLTKHEGSAKHPKIITGPMLWNKESTAIYMSITNFVGQTEKFPTYLARVAVDSKKEEKIIDLPEFYLKELAFREYDRATIYALSPDENWVAFQQDRNLVIKNIKNSTSKLIWDQRKISSFPDEPLATKLLKIRWAPNGWLYFSAGCDGCASGIGDIWGSLNGVKAVKLAHGQIFTINLDGEKIAYNFEYFGRYYVAPEEPFPTDWEKGVDDTGHQYDGIGVYDVNSKKELKLSGKNKPSGYIWTWFW